MSVVVPKEGLAFPATLKEATEPLPDEQLVGTYPMSKAAAERLVLAANSHVLKTVALRPGGIYGMGDPVGPAGRLQWWLWWRWRWASACEAGLGAVSRPRWVGV